MSNPVKRPAPAAVPTKPQPVAVPQPVATPPAAAALPQTPPFGGSKRRWPLWLDYAQASKRRQPPWLDYAQAWIADPRRRGPWLVGLLILASLLIRLPNLHSPLLEVHPMRQTHNGFTVWCYLQDGIDLMHPSLPILGPPWVYVVEFPIYQATAALLIRITGMDIDTGCRLTNLIYFYASAGMLYLLAGKLFQRRSAAVCILLFYLWTPFSIVWSRTAMTEFAGVFFCLAYVYFMSVWLEDRGKLAFFFLALVAGILGALAKITTMLPLVPLLLVLPTAAIWNDMRRQDPALKPTNLKKLAKMLGDEWLDVVALLALYLIPAVIGQAWTSYGDRVNGASAATRWLTSANMSAWHYGTLEQRLTAEWWRVIVYRITAYITPFAFMALPVVALVVVQKGPALARWTLYAAVAGAILPVLILFNLYHEHDYYLIAVLPLIALLAGYGLDYVAQKWVLADWRTAVPIVAAAAISVFIAWDYVSPSYSIDYNNPMCKLGKAIANATDPRDYVVVGDFDWTPAILYYAKRRGFMVRKDHAEGAWPDVHSFAFLRSSRFTTLVVRNHHDWFDLWPGGFSTPSQFESVSILRINH